MQSIGLACYVSLLWILFVLLARLSNGWRPLFTCLGLWVCEHYVAQNPTSSMARQCRAMACRTSVQRVQIRKMSFHKAAIQMEQHGPSNIFCELYRGLYRMFPVYLHGEGKCSMHFAATMLDAFFGLLGDIGMGWVWTLTRAMLAWSSMSMACVVYGCQYDGIYLEALGPQWQQNAKGIKLCAIKQYLPCRKMICSKTLEKIKLLQQDRGSRDDQNGSTAARCSESCMFFIWLQLGTLHHCAIAAGFLLILYLCIYICII